MMSTPWPFEEPENTAVFTSKKIVFGDHWIEYVTHDADDGAWQFHPSDGTTEQDAAVVGLKEIVVLDESVLSLADLPLGWHAWRESRCSPWVRSPRGRKGGMG